MSRFLLSLFDVFTAFLLTSTCDARQRSPSPFSNRVLASDVTLPIACVQGFNLNVSVDEFELYRDSLRREESPMPSPVLSASLDHWGVDMQLSPTLSPVPSYAPIQMPQQRLPQHPHIRQQQPAVHHYPVHPVMPLLPSTPGGFIFSATVVRPPKEQALPYAMPAPAQAWSFASLAPSGMRNSVWSTAGDTRMEPRGSSVRNPTWPTSGAKKQGLAHGSRAALQLSVGKIGKIGKTTHTCAFPAMLPPVHAIPAWLLA